MPQLFDRGRVEAISLIVLGRSAGGEIAVAFALVFTQGADALHVVQHQWFDAREIVAVDAEGVEQFRQFIRSMRPETRGKPANRLRCGQTLTCRAGASR